MQPANDSNLSHAPVSRDENISQTLLLFTCPLDVSKYQFVGFARDILRWASDLLNGNIDPGFDEAIMPSDAFQPEYILFNGSFK